MRSIIFIMVMLMFNVTNYHAQSVWLNGNIQYRYIPQLCFSIFHIMSKLINHVVSNVVYFIFIYTSLYVICNFKV